MGYFVLGPTELFKLTKEIGKFIQNFRTLGAEASKSFESTMENQLELTELRKAQSELNSAFNFRRSINVDQESEAFSELPKIAETGAAAATTTTVVSATPEEPPTTRKKKKRRRVKKKVEEIPEEIPYSGDIPDLDMTSAFQDEFKQNMGLSAPVAGETEAELAARLRKERLQRLEISQVRAEQASAAGDEWFSASESEIASELIAQQPSPEEAEAASNRFAQQLSGKWNDNILDNEEQLSPLAKIMEQLAILEDERSAANLRLDDEFARRQEIEEKFYREKRELLETAAAEVSAAAYSNFDFSEDGDAKEEKGKDNVKPDLKSKNGETEPRSTVKESNVEKYDKRKEMVSSEEIKANKENGKWVSSSIKDKATSDGKEVVSKTE